MCCPHTPQVSKRLRRDSPLGRSAGPCRLSASFSPPMATGPARQGPATTGDSSIVWRRRKSCRWQPHQALKRPSGQLPLSPPQGRSRGAPPPQRSLRAPAVATSNRSRRNFGRERSRSQQRRQRPPGPRPLGEAFQCRRRNPLLQRHAPSLLIIQGKLLPFSPPASSPPERSAFLGAFFRRAKFFRFVQLSHAPFRIFLVITCPLNSFYFPVWSVWVPPFSFVPPSSFSLRPINCFF